MISTKGRYALRVMIDLARNENEEFVPLKDIAARQGISKKYLEILVRDMVTANLIVGVRGKGGGYKLCRKPEEYNIGEILQIMEGSLSPVACLIDKKFDCPRKSTCDTLHLWTEFDSMIHDFFYSRKLSDLINRDL